MSQFFHCFLPLFSQEFLSFFGISFNSGFCPFFSPFSPLLFSQKIVHFFQHLWICFIQVFFVEFFSLFSWHLCHYLLNFLKFILTVFSLFSSSVFTRVFVNFFFVFEFFLIQVFVPFFFVFSRCFHKEIGNFFQHLWICCIQFFSLFSQKKKFNLNFLTFLNFHVDISNIFIYTNKSSELIIYLTCEEWRTEPSTLFFFKIWLNTFLIEKLLENESDLTRGI